MNRGGWGWLMNREGGVGSQLMNREGGGGKSAYE